MTVLRQGIIKSYAAATHRADVQLLGSLATNLTASPVAAELPGSAVKAGRECAVLFFDPSNPDDAVIIAVYGADTHTPPAKIADADADTSVDTEQTADEDIIRVKVAASERLTIQDAVPQFVFSGELQLIDGSFLLSGTPSQLEHLSVLSTLPGQAGFVQAAARVNPIIDPAASGRSFDGIASLCSVQSAAAYTVPTVNAFSFEAQRGDDTVIVQNLRGIFIKLADNGPSNPNTPADVSGIRTDFAWLGTGPATWHGLYIDDIPKGTTRYAIRILKPTTGIQAGQTAYGILIQDFTDSLGTQWPLYYGVGGGVRRFAIDRQGVVYLPSFTTAGRPAAGTAGRLIYVSDAAAGQKFQGDDGAAWVPLG